MNAVVTEQLSLRGVDISYEQAGNGRPLVCLHGNYASKRWFTEQLAAPPPGWHVVAPDLPNFGESGALPEPIRIEAYADYLSAFIKALGLRRPVVLGHSLGGAVAQVYASQSPSTLAGLILVASAPPGSLYGLGTLDLKPTLPQGLKLPKGVSLPKGVRLPDLSKLTSKLSSIKVPSVVPTGFQGGGERARLAQALRSVMPSREVPYFDAIVDDALRMRPEAVSGHLQALMRYDTSHLDKVTCPVLVLRGARDTIITEKMARKTAAAFPNATLELWPEIGHSPQLEAPERFNLLMTKFLEGVRRGPP